MNKMRVRLLLVISVGCLFLGAAVAQPENPPLTDLSFTTEQVDSGHSEYTQSCTDCHGQNLNDGEFGGPSLKGQYFQSKWFGKSVGALVSYVHAAMPPDAPGRLPLATYVEIVAYILNTNGIPAGSQALPADMDLLAKLRIPPAPAGAPAARP